MFTGRNTRLDKVAQWRVL